MLLGVVAQAGGIGGWGPMAAHVCLRLTADLYGDWDLNLHIRLSVTEDCSTALSLYRRPWSSGPLWPSLAALLACFPTFPLVPLVSLRLGVAPVACFSLCVV